MSAMYPKITWVYGIGYVDAVIDYGPEAWKTESGVTVVEDEKGHWAYPPCRKWRIVDLMFGKLEAKI